MQCAKVRKHKLSGWTAVALVPFLHIKNSWIKQYNLEKAIKDAVWVVKQLFKKNDLPGEKEKHL